ncbi:MAG: serine hydrolase [Patescibacteria group bacterium]
MSIINLFKNPKDKNQRDDSDEEEKEIRRPKKEVYKPWGKKERLLVLSVLLVTILSSSILGISSRDWKLPGIPRLTFPKSFLGEETYVIEKKTDGKATGTSQEKIDQTISAFKNKTDNTSGVWGFYAIDLSDKVSYGLNQDEIFQAASLIKLPIMSLVYKKYEEGEINLDEKVPGSTSTYRELVREMGKRSDNSAQITLVNTFGKGKIDAYINEIRMRKTSLEENETSPKDVGLFFKMLWEEDLVSTKSRDEILGYLTNTIYEDWLVAGIPKGIRVAHKYGSEVHVVNDAGIVYGPKPFVVVIMSKGVVEKEANEIFPELAKIIYDAEK